MVSRAGRGGNKRFCYCPEPEQGDVLLVDFGEKRKGSRNLFGNRPVYVLSNQSTDAPNSVFMVIPLFRKGSKDNICDDIEIKKDDCRGLRYDEYAQPMNALKIRRHQIVKRIGKVKNKSVHTEILSSMWKQINKEEGTN